MTRAIAWLGIALLAAGCGAKDGRPTAEQASATGKPGADATKACIVEYLNQCGWKDVELAQLTDQPAVPPEAKVIGDAWAYSFTANYTNVFGERRTSEGWLAVVVTADGKPSVRNCFDADRKMVGGHTGAESPEKAALAKLPPAEDLPPIVPPTP